MSYALAGAPAAIVLAAAIVSALGAGLPNPGPPNLKPGTDVGRARASLMTMLPNGTPADVAFAKLRDQGLSCQVSKPPLANLTWRIIECSTPPSPGGAILVIDVAGRNGIVADIGVEDVSCASRADVNSPAPEPGGCDLSGKRLLDFEAWQRRAAGALLADTVGSHAATPKPH